MYGHTHTHTPHTTRHTHTHTPHTPHTHTHTHTHTEITSIPSSTLQTVSVIDFDYISLACLNFDLPSYLQISWTSLTPGHIPNDRVGVSLATGELWFANFNSLSGDDNTVYTCSVSNSITGSTQPMAAQYRLQISGSGQ